MAREEFIRCDFDDPDCCAVCMQKNLNKWYKCVPGTTRCPRHGAASQLRSDKRKKANAYRIQMYNQRIREFNGNDQIQILREEIAILRVVLEEMMNKASETGQLLALSSRIESIVASISKNVSSCERLEKSLGQLMDKPTQFKFVTALIDILNRHIDDADVLEDISEEILNEMASL